MAIEPKIFVVLRNVKPGKKVRRHRTWIVDAVAAASQDDANRLARDRNPVRPHEELNAVPLFVSDQSMKIAADARVKRDAELEELKALFAV
jgi:hypothetical protein